MSLRRSVVLALGAVVLTATLAACVPEPAESPTPDAVPTGEGTVAPLPTPTAPATATTLPDSCDALYSGSMLASLEASVAPLNDPGVELLASQQAGVLDLLDTVPTLRCSWGPPGERGLVTNASVVDETQAGAVLAELTGSGFGCDVEGDATVCRIEQRGVTLDDVEYVRGETHALRGDLWVATNWVNVDPEGYTEDILATLAG